MNLIITCVIILVSVITSYGQKFTLQDTTFNIGDVLISQDILFDFNKAIISSENYDLLDSIASFLQKNKKLTIEVSLHSDERGSGKYS
ncbi:OmpA family protein [Sporocytophaga myxococcoides]|uniref:OmpA family protein n=1 Tax=Sporocytophaga myxococcoides TaxID=153721 RepID=UPI0012E027C3|nr:OmpA family protein [Sporocytophaga myxococcoides]